ncbi:hypothetical protein RF11_13011 [Thelohanellus kitauei]|uniref:Uncharacterized protein n=1 Tax=Thelohanellus kitauei TaxID=669202 RepID=A0A0C2IG53_THEKT|nr:hypothetical protein RF11_13011 [Thelohanellus kitauei]
MLIFIVPLFSIISFHLIVNDKKVPTEFNVTLKQAATDLYNVDTIRTNFNPDTSEFTIEFQNHIREWSEIKCFINEYETEIEISECIVSFLIRVKEYVVNDSVGYRFKFNKKIKYEFKNHFMELYFDVSRSKLITSRFEDISIEFDCFNQICEFDNNWKLVELFSESNELVYPCQNIGPIPSNTSDTCELSKNVVTIS